MVGSSSSSPFPSVVSALRFLTRSVELTDSAGPFLDFRASATPFLEDNLVVLVALLLWPSSSGLARSYCSLASSAAPMVNNCSGASLIPAPWRA